MQEMIKKLEKDLPPTLFFSMESSDFSYQANSQLTIECDVESLKIYGHKGKLSVDITRTQKGLQITQILLEKLQYFATNEQNFPYSLQVDNYSVYLTNQQEWLIIAYCLINAEHSLAILESLQQLPKKQVVVTQMVKNNFL